MGTYHQIPELPLYGGIGLRSLFGTIIPPQVNVQFVRSTGYSASDHDSLQSRIVKTIPAALARCTSGAGDYVFVLPGHVETVGTTLFTNLVPGTKIIGLGSPDQDDAPTWNWTGATDKLTVDDKNVTIAGMRMMMNGANTIAEAIAVSAAGVKLLNNYIVTGTGDPLDCAKPVDVEAGATNFLFQGNTVRQTGGTTTSVLALAAVVDGIRILDNDIIMIGSAAGTGIIDISGAVTNVLIQGNVLQQRHASSTACISVADVASTGVIRNNDMTTLNDGTASAQGIVFAGVTTTTIKCFQNFSADEPGLSGLLGPVAST